MRLRRWKRSTSSPNNHRWGAIDDWNRAAQALHERGGIHRIEDPRYPPFWAVIDHAALLDVERRPELFTNAPESVLATRDALALDNRQFEVKTLIHLDGDHHAKMRRLTADWFKPSSLDRLGGRLDELSAQAVGRTAAAGTACDFARDIALPYPLQVIPKILGLPESDYDRMLVLTQQLFGGEDPDLQRAAPSPEVQAQVIGDFYQYFVELTANHRTDPDRRPRHVDRQRHDRRPGGARRCCARWSLRCCRASSCWNWTVNRRS